MGRLDEAYAVGAFIAGGADYPDRWAEAARAHRAIEAAVGRARLNLPYGPGARQGFDLFLPAGRPQGLMVLVHGGFWRRFGRGDWSHLAAGAQAAGWAAALPSYTLAPEARISQITREVSSAVARAAAEVPGVPMALTGHSAGGHLVARMLCRDIALPEDVLARIGRVVPISPLADLAPLMETAMNDDLRLDAAEARAESPVTERRPRPADVTVWVGGDERPAFLVQARLLAEAWPGAVLHVEPGRHHFDVIDGLARPGSGLLRAVLG